MEKVEQVQYSIKRTAGQKHMYIWILKDGKVLVSVGTKHTLADIEQFVLSKKEWIDQRKLMVISDISHDYQDNSVIPVMGKPYVLSLCRGKGTNCLVDDKMVIAVPLFKTPHKVKEQAAIKRGIKEIYEKELTPYLEERLTFWAEKLNVKKPKFVFSMATRWWGLCTRKNGEDLLKFSYICGPIDKKFIDYVVLHETCHILHHNHKSEFWALLGQHMENWKEIRAEMKDKDFVEEAMSVFK